ncbi:Endonuclease/Exonuclease/phosphatase family protein [Planococcus halocryophilus Or1]|nr:endonuclease/exonuclease/phosphatase family protein [Planococcus halocryophilus]EMF47420.1 Endonuclease/Exonuclease/phosphatase family protein [Planococcus halocryophilus Or1]
MFTFKYTVLKTGDLKIRDIQGTDHYSNYQGVVVNEIEGIVTHIYNSANFVIQDTNPDDDITTSEALIVNKASNGLEVGDLVTVNGTVEEHFQEGYSDAKDNDLPITRIRATNVAKTGTAPLPEPIVIGEDVQPPSEQIDNDGLTSFDPEEDGIDFWESLELMRLAVPNAQVVGPQKYGEVIVVAENSPNTEFHKQGGILLSENDYNPERVIVDFDNESYVAKAGDSFNGTITGVLGFGFGNYKLWSRESDLPQLVDGGTQPEQTWIAKDEEKLTVAAYNVENFSADPSHTSDAKAQRIAESFVNDLNSPDIIVMVEVQDNDGPITSGNSDATASYERLIEGIQAAGGPTYAWTDIAPEYNQDGGQPGGNIRVGYLYNPERVTLSEGTKGTATETNSWVDGELALNPGRVQPIAMPNTRKPIAAQFDFQGEQVVVIGAHLNSKGGDQPLFGKNQPPFLGSVEERIELATAINGFIADGLEQNPDLNVIVAGDMNDFEFTPALQALKGDILTNKVEDVPLEDRYSYYYQGNSQVLDHLLVTNNLAQRTELDMVHINAMFMEEHGRASDHDPLLAQISFEKPAVPGEQTAKPDLSGDQAVVTAGEPGENGELAITFTEGTVAKLLESGKDLLIDMPTADLTLSASHLQQIANAAGEGFVLNLAVDDATEVDKRPTLTNQINMFLTDAEGNELPLKFTLPVTLAFDTTSDIKIQFGAREDEKGKWKIIQGELAGDVFTLSINELGNYTVVTNKGQMKKK